MGPAIWVGQFNIAGGEAREEGPYTAFFPASREGCDLGVVAEAALSGSALICQELVATVGRQFRRQRLSITGGLLRALRAAHAYLLDWNRRSLLEHRLAVGVSCVAWRGGEAYLAQVGPAIAFWWREGKLERLEPQEEAAQPLGLAQELWPAFYRCQLSPGHRLLLATTALAALADEAQMAAALALAPQEALASLYRLARSLPDGAALLLAL